MRRTEQAQGGTCASVPGHDGRPVGSLRLERQYRDRRASWRLVGKTESFTCTPRYGLSRSISTAPARSECATSRHFLTMPSAAPLRFLRAMRARSALPRAPSRKRWPMRSAPMVGRFGPKSGYPGSAWISALCIRTMPAAILLALSATGARYHSSATARDRDKVRQAVLEDLGWTILRVWSADWFSDSARCCRPAP